MNTNEGRSVAWFTDIGKARSPNEWNRIELQNTLRLLLLAENARNVCRAWLMWPGAAKWRSIKQTRGSEQHALWRAHLSQCDSEILLEQDNVFINSFPGFSSFRPRQPGPWRGCPGRVFTGAVHPFLQVIDYDIKSKPRGGTLGALLWSFPPQSADDQRCGLATDWQPRHA